MAYKFDWRDPKLPWSKKGGIAATGPALSGHEGVVMVGRRRFAVGLFWKSARSLVAAKRDALKLGPQMKLDAVALRRSAQNEAQFGLGYKGAGFKIGMYSLAGVVTHNVRERSWVGLWEVREGFVFIHVSKGLIQGDGDRLIRDEPEAKKALLDCLKDVDVERVFLPATMVEAIKKDAEKTARAEGSRAPMWLGKISTEVLGVYTGTVPSDCKIGNVSGATPFGIIIGWTGTAAGVSFMVLEICQALGVTGPLFAPKVAPIVLRKPDYIGHVSPSAMIKGCELGILQRRMDGVAGFRFSSASCRETSVEGVYRRAGMSLLHASTKSMAGLPGRYGDKDTIVVAVSPGVSGEAVEAGATMVSEQDAERIIWGIQQLGNITGGVDKYDTVGGMDEGVAGVVSWHFESGWSPRLYMGYLGRAGTSIIDRVGFSADTNLWHVDGRTFVR